MSRFLERSRSVATGVASLCLLVASAALEGCYPDSDARPSGRPMITSCGLNYTGASEYELACLQRQENITLEALSSISTDVQWTREVTCPQLAGARVNVVPMADGGTWSDDLFFHLTDEYDRGDYSDGELAVNVSSEDWSNPEFSWQLVRIITRGKGDPSDTLWWTGEAIAEAANRGRDPSVEPIPPQLSGAVGESP